MVASLQTGCSFIRGSRPPFHSFILVCFLSPLHSRFLFTRHDVLGFVTAGTIMIIMTLGDEISRAVVPSQVYLWILVRALNKVLPPQRPSSFYVPQRPNKRVVFGAC